MKYAHIVRAILSRPWAIDPESVAWAAIVDVLSLRASGESLSDQEIEARIAAAKNGPRAGGSRDRNVAVIPIYGVLSPRADLLSRSSGGTSAEDVLSSFRAALRDPEIDGIVFDVDSPGGVVEGIDELASEIRAARGEKPIAAVANHLAASAAYWAIAGVDEIVATPSASVGSIGIFTAHQDVSAAMEQKGIRTTLISAGKYKVEGNQFEALGEEARTAIQEQVDAWYSTMTSSIAKGRGVSVETVRAEFGEGRTLLAKKALTRGMIDRIDSLDNTIRRVARGTVGRPSGVALTDGIRVAAVASASATDDQDNAGPATSFAARVEAAAAETRAIGELARNRAALRAADGRAPSPADVSALSTLVAAFASLDGVEVETTETVETTTTETVEETVETEAPATEEAAPRGRRLGLELLEAATAGGYVLPS